MTNDEPVGITYYLIRGFEGIQCTDASEKLKSSYTVEATIIRGKFLRFLVYKSCLLRSRVTKAAPLESSLLQDCSISTEVDKLHSVSRECKQFCIYDITALSSVDLTKRDPGESPLPSASTIQIDKELVRPSVQFHTVTSSDGSVSLAESSNVKKALNSQRRISYLLLVIVMIVSLSFCAYFFRAKLTSKTSTPPNQPSAAFKPSKTMQTSNVSLTVNVFFDCPTWIDASVFGWSLAVVLSRSFDFSIQTNEQTLESVSTSMHRLVSC